MRTAEEILEEKIAPMPYSIDPYKVFESMKEVAIKAINEARIETIKECAEVAKVKVEGGNGYASIDKQSILKLLNQIK